MRTCKVTIFAGLVASAVPQVSIAADAGLYAAPPPANAAAVRLVDANSTGARASADVGTLHFEAGADRPSPYKYVTQGTVALKAAGFSSQRQIVAGKYYSLLSADYVSPKLYLLEDPTPSISKATLVFYNLSKAKGVSLKTADGSTELISSMGAGSMTSLEVNPINVSFGVFSGDKRLGIVGPVQLQRGSSFGVILIHVGGNFKVVGAPGAAVGR